MVKVISQGVYRKTCHKCSSVLEYTYHDIQESIHTDYSGSREIYRFIICPVCKNVTTVS